MLEEHEVIAAVRTLTQDRLRVFIEYGWIRPGRRGRETVYSEIDVARLQLVCHLTDELEVNENAVPVILSLVDQLFGLRRELRTLAKAVEQQPTATQAQIAEIFRALSEERA